jgi:hypothetical protein
MDPVNYQFADPAAAILNGLKTGVAINELQFQQQQQQAAMAQAQRQQADLQALAMNPNATHADYAAVMTKYPGIAENLGKAFQTLNQAQQQNLIDFGSRVYAAALSGNTDLAANLLEQRAKADPAKADQYTQMAGMMRQNPSAARMIAGLNLGAAMGPDKFATAFQNFGTEARAEQLQPLTVAKATGDAQEALAKGGAAQTTVDLANQKTGEEILSSQAQRQVAAFNAQIAAANSETERGRLTLERDKFIQEQKQKNYDIGQDAQDKFNHLSSSLDLVHNIQADLGNWWNFNGVGSVGGKLAALIPGTDAKDFRAKVDTLKSQQFLNQAKDLKGMGALSDAEGARIERAVASLDTDQSPQAFSNALGIIETTLARGQQRITASGRLPATGGAVLMRHPTFGNVSETDITRLMAQNPGTTRDQVLQFLRSTGGK